MSPKIAAVAIAMAAAKASAMRNARALKTSAVGIEFEPDGADIDDKLALSGRIELAPEIADLHVDDVGRRHEFEIPHILKQHRARHDLVGAGHEILEQLELLGEEIDRPALAERVALDQIHLQYAGLEPGRARFSAPPQKRLDARPEFPQIERLDEIIVAAAFQSVDPLIDRRERADQQHRRRDPLFAQRLDDRQPVRLAEHPIDDENRGPAGAGGVQPVISAMRNPDAIARGFEFEANLLGDFPLVLDNEHFGARRSEASVRRHYFWSLDKRRHHGFEFPELSPRYV